MRDVVEGAHMNHPDFRRGGRIFATLHADRKRGMVRLPMADQERFCREHPASFEPAAGAWGRQGCTMVTLSAVDEETLGEAMTVAWQASPPPAQSASKRSKRP